MIYLPSQGVVVLIRFIKKYLHILWFSFFGIISILYFVLQHIGLDYHTIHIKADDMIPFLPVFIIPYILWYAYVPAPMIYSCFRDKDTFIRQVTALFSGSILCIAVFFIYPSQIDFRPEIHENGILEQLCRLIFSNDAPVNVMPSLHCYEATVIHLVSFRHGKLKSHTGLRVVSAVTAVLICLSTVFVKQHSVLDLLVGCSLAAAIYILTELIFDWRIKNDRKAI